MTIFYIMLPVLLFSAIVTLKIIGSENKKKTIRKMLSKATLVIIFVIFIISIIINMADKKGNSNTGVGQNNNVTIEDISEIKYNTVS